MDQVFVVRHKVLVEKRSVRQVAREMGISRNTVRRYVEGAPIGVRRPTVRPKPVTDLVAARVAAILEDSRSWTAGKQRLTATRLHGILRAEGNVVGETVVKRLVREWRRRRREVFVPLAYKPGELAEVDFFEVILDVAGVRGKAWMFVMRLMHSGRDFAWIYPRQDQTCFLDGHVRAFAHFDAVPHRLAYDNLRAAVARMLAGSERELSARFAALATHYVFEPCFARPRTGHDKGGVEARGKGIRWQELVPIPSGPDLGAISGSLMARLDARAAEPEHVVDGKTIAERFSVEQSLMLPLPAAPFVAAALRPVIASRRALIQTEGATYSVWSRWAGLDLRAYVGVDTVEIVGPDARVVHPRQSFGGRSVDYRHYLPELARKPQAVRQVAAELVRDLGEPFGALWRQLVDERGPKQAARVFAKVLDALVQLGHRVVVERVERALADGEHVLLALAPPAAPPPPLDVLPPSLAGIEVTAGVAADYDRLLGGGQ